MYAMTESAGNVATPIVGFRDAVLRGRPSGTPKQGWSAADYAQRARRRVAGAQRRSREVAEAARDVPLQRGLEIGCGGGLDCVLTALDGIDVVGIDADSPLLSADRRGPALTMIDAAVGIAGAHEDAETLLARLPVQIRAMDACALDLPDASFDLVWSRVVLEHIHPIAAVLAETARVLRPGGIAHHVIDPYYWLNGCHARGLTELPWAHARLALEDYERFVRVAESRRRAAKRTAWLRTLNALSVDGWRALLNADRAFELLTWSETHSPLAEQMLERHPEVLDDLLAGVTVGDLTCSAITVVLRRTSEAPPR